MVKTHPRSKIYTVEALTFNSNCLVVGPATISSFPSYSDEHFISSMNDAHTKAGFVNSQIDMSMNNVIILFEPLGSAVNDYLITLQIQDAIRFPTFTLL